MTTDDISFLTKKRENPFPYFKMSALFAYKNGSGNGPSFESFSMRFQKLGFYSGQLLIVTGAISKERENKFGYTNYVFIF